MYMQFHWERMFTTYTTLHNTTICDLIREHAQVLIKFDTHNMRCDNWRRLQYNAQSSLLSTMGILLSYTGRFTENNTLRIWESPRRQAHAGEVHLICSRNVVKILRCQIRVLVQDITYASMSNDDSNSPRYGARVRALFDLEIIAKPTSKQQMKSSCVRAVCVCVCWYIGHTSVPKQGLIRSHIHVRCPLSVSHANHWATHVEQPGFAKILSPPKL